MKKSLKNLAIAITLFAFGIANVGAISTSTKAIYKNACEGGKVYTNYYFLLEAETTDYMSSKNLNTLVNTNRALYNNNSFMDFYDASNIGYGQVKVNSTTATSSDGITSMSITDFYNYYLKAVNSNSGNNKGVYQYNNANYIASHDYQRYENNTWVNKTGQLDLKGYTVGSLARASMDADSFITRITEIQQNYYGREFVLEISRSNYRNLTGTPITYNNKNWYLQPALYYLQYCRPIIGNHAIKYVANGDNVTNMPENTTYADGNCGTISKVEPKRNGYKFLGWSTNKDAKTADANYAAGKQYCNGDLTLYAIWEKNDVKYYAINYDKNTNDTVINMPTNIVYLEGTCATLSKTEPVRTGYKFLGWNTDKNAKTGNANYAGDKKYCAGNLTLYAIWEKVNVNSFYVIYDPNTTDVVTNVPANIIYTEGTCATLSQLEPKRNGYIFKGWNTDKNAKTGDIKYTGGTEYCVGNLTLYAIWEKASEDTYTVSYRPNTTDVVSNMPSDETKLTTEDATISSSIPVRVGYKFLGWNTDANAKKGDDAFKGGVLYVNRKDLVLYAIWEKNQVLPDNPKTGIEDVILPISGTIATSLTGLVVLKKKKSFVQF